MKLNYVPRNNVFYKWRAYRKRYIFKNLKCLYYAFKSAWQRFKYGYSIGDVWDMDQWFYSVIPQMLRTLRDYGSSYPSAFAELPDNEGEEKWKEILTDMANSIEAGAEEVKYLPQMTQLQFKALQDRRRARLKHGLDLMYQYMDSLWD